MRVSRLQLCVCVEIERFSAIKMRFELLSNIWKLLICVRKTMALHLQKKLEWREISDDRLQPQYIISNEYDEKLRVSIICSLDETVRVLNQEKC